MVRLQQVYLSVSGNSSAFLREFAGFVVTGRVFVELTSRTRASAAATERGPPIFPNNLVCLQETGVSLCLFCGTLELFQSLFQFGKVVSTNRLQGLLQQQTLSWREWERGVGWGSFGHQVFHNSLG